MVYSTYMKIKKLVPLFITVLIFSFASKGALAQSPTFSFYPPNGVISDVEKGFILDVLIDSGSYNISKAKAVIKFDPKVVQLTKALRNESLFEEWPFDQQSTDNLEGIVMITGITQSQGSALYSTQGDPDVLARLEFDVITSEKQDVVFEILYTGGNEQLSSIILDSVSSENVLRSNPPTAVYSLDVEEVPETGIDMNTLGIIMGVFLILIGGYIRGSKVEIFSKRRGTVVLTE